MIAVKQAVNIAMKYLADLFESQDIAAQRLEEVELSDDGKFWYVTLSFVRGMAPGAMAAALGASSVGREYKTLTIRTDDGEVLSVKIRQLV